MSLVFWSETWSNRRLAQAPGRDIMAGMKKARTTIAHIQQGQLFGIPAKKTAPRAMKTPTPKIRPSPSFSPQPRPLAPGKKRWLSATAMESMRRCPRCFWLQMNLGLYQPEGIVSRLANRFDSVIKKYFDIYRGTETLPPMIDGQVEGQLESPFQELYFANINTKYGFKGKLDECLVRDDGTFTPVDHKTASSDPTKRDLIPAYQFQLDSYAYLLEQNRKPASGIGHLVYFYPDDGQALHTGFPMQITVKTLSTNPARVPATLKEAVALLDGPLPSSGPACVFCEYVEQVKKF